MRIFAVIGVVLSVLLVAAAGYAYLGFYNVAASEPHTGLVRWSLDLVMHRSVERQVDEAALAPPALDDPALVRTGARHFVEEGCAGCHGAPGMEPRKFAETMRPAPPDLGHAARHWDDAELFWIMKNGVKMSGMPAFGPSHDDAGLWAMVAFVQQLPEMSPERFRELTAAEADGHGHADGAGHGHEG